MKIPTRKGSLRAEGRARRRHAWSGWRLEALEARSLLSLASVVQASMGDDEGFLSDGSVNVSGLTNPLTPSPAPPSPGPGANVNTDPASPVAPHNETSIAVNPTNANNLIGSANDYQYYYNSRTGQVTRTAYSEAHVSSNGGKTWTDYTVPFNTSLYNFTGDPAVAFDANGTAYLGTLGFMVDASGNITRNPDVLVTHSTNGGKTWATPTQVALATAPVSGTDLSGFTIDKDYVAAWGNGNAIVTFTEFFQDQNGNYVSSPIYASVTHDGGNTWTTPSQISGSDGLFSQGSTPVVNTDAKGNVTSISVAFLNGDDDVAPQYRDYYKVVQVDPATGQAIPGGVATVGLVYDGVNDYPINADGRETYQDSQFRTWSLGNLTSDPTDPGHLALVWSDMRDNPYPGAVLPHKGNFGDPNYVPPDPYHVKTNSDIVVSQSFDGGKTWSAPTVIKLPNDQFMPWGAYSAQGLLQIGFFDRSYDPANHAYGYTVASENHAGKLDFSFQQATNTLSDPTQGNAWFVTTQNPKFPNATVFIGDYSGIAVTPSGKVAAFWTDQRNAVNFSPTHIGASQDAYFSLVTPGGKPPGPGPHGPSPADAPAADAVVIPQDNQSGDDGTGTPSSSKSKHTG
jgi:hypothetical protein